MLVAWRVSGIVRVCNLTCWFIVDVYAGFMSTYSYFVPSSFWGKLSFNHTNIEICFVGEPLKREISNISRQLCHWRGHTLPKFYEVFTYSPYKNWWQRKTIRIPLGPGIFSGANWLNFHGRMHQKFCLIWTRWGERQTCGERWNLKAGSLDSNEAVKNALVIWV